jgi:2-methylcitrate dehydratase PrpD
MEVVHQLARYVVAARERDLPDQARAAACRSVLDLVAAAAAGIAGPGPAAIRETALATLAPGDHPVWFSGSRAGSSPHRRSRTL